jgi:hypothetical protein
MQSIESLESRIAPAAFIVTNLNPNGSGSLRDAIVQANENPGSDLIVFRKGLTGTIAVVGGEMQITDTLTIKGPGASKLTLDANLTSRIFTVTDDDPEKDSPLTVSGLTFFHGSDPNQDTSGGSLEFALVGSKVIGNVSEEGLGGGIALRTTAPAFIVSSIIARNVASVGGGIGVTGKLTLNDSTVTGNIATVLVGGILISAQTPVLNGTQVFGNVSPDGVQIGED